MDDKLSSIFDYKGCWLCQVFIVSTPLHSTPYTDLLISSVNRLAPLVLRCVAFQNSSSLPHSWQSSLLTQSNLPASHSMASFIASICSSGIPSRYSSRQGIITKYSSTPLIWHSSAIRRSQYLFSLMCYFILYYKIILQKYKL